MSSFLFNLGDTGAELKARAEKEALFAPALAALRAEKPGRLAKLFRERFSGDGIYAPPAEILTPMIAAQAHDLLAAAIEVFDDAADLPALRSRLALEGKMGSLRGTADAVREGTLAVAALLDDVADTDKDLECKHEVRSGGMTAKRSWLAWAQRVQTHADALRVLKEMGEAIDKLAAERTADAPADDGAEPASVPFTAPAAAAPAESEQQQVQHILRRRSRVKKE